MEIEESKTVNYDNVCQKHHTVKGIYCWDCIFEVGKREEIKENEKMILEHYKTVEEARQEGIREVVKFVDNQVFPMLNMASVPVYFKDKWNNKLEEWDIA